MTKAKIKEAIQKGLSSCELLTYTDGDGVVWLLEHEGMLMLAVDEIYEALIEYEVINE